MNEYIPPDSIKSSQKNSKFGSRINSLKLIDDEPINKLNRNKVFSQNELANLKKNSFKDESLVNYSNLNESNLEKKNLLAPKPGEKSKIFR